MSEMQFGAPPPSPSGMNRLFPWVRTAATGGAIAAAAIYLLQVGLPEGWRPSSVAGDAAGDTMRHEIQAMKAEKIDLERRLADATSQPVTKAQTDFLVMQRALETTAESVDPLAKLAGAADVFCLLGQAVATMSAPSGQVRGDWRGVRTDNGSADINSAARAVVGVSCGVSPAIRESIRATQLAAVRDVAAARGMQMTNGAVQASTPSELEGHALQAVDRITTASQHYDYADVEKVQKWVAGLPVTVQDHIHANLPNNSTGWDLFVDRARAVDAVIRANG